MIRPEALEYDRAAERIGRILLGLGLAGAAIAGVLGGWAWAVGFFLGSLVAGLNYRWLRRAVEGMAGERRKGPRAAVLALRYAALGGAAYVILRYSRVSLPAVFAGVFTLTAAVMIEAVIQIVYARK